MGTEGSPYRLRMRPGTHLPVARCPVDIVRARAVQRATAECLRLPPRFDNSIGMTMLLVPAGEYRMGKPTGRPKPTSPSHLPRANWLIDCVRRRWERMEWPFYVAACPVTQAQFADLMGRNPSRYKRLRRWSRGRYPAESVLWAEAVEFCHRLSAREGRTYRLPTMAEWEYFCRAGSNERFFFGPDYQTLAKCGWYAGNSGLRPRPVGRRVPNVWGLHDVHGNVFEWCEDPWDLVLLSGDGSLPNDELADYHPARGGAYHCSAALCSAYIRGWFHPRVRYPIVGMRPVCEL